MYEHRLILHDDPIDWKDTVSLLWSVHGISLTLKALRDELHQALFTRDLTGWHIPERHVTQ